jgi:hypothetical protein
MKSEVSMAVKIYVNLVGCDNMDSSFGKQVPVFQTDVVPAYQNTLHHIPEDSKFHGHHFKNFNFKIDTVVLWFALRGVTKLSEPSFSAEK